MDSHGNGKANYQLKLKDTDRYGLRESQYSYKATITLKNEIRSRKRIVERRGDIV